jgi:hypothetical protein
MGRFSGGGGGGGGVSLATAEALADAAEAAAAVYTDAVALTLASIDVDAIPFISGELHLLAGHTGGAAAQPANRVVAMLPFRTARACTLSKLAVEQTAAGEVGSMIRLLIVEDLNGLPTDVLWQSANIPGDGANGEKSADPDLAIVPTKLYYAGVQCHTATTTRPTLRYFQSPATGSRTRTTAVTSTGRQGYGYAMGTDAAVTDPMVAATVAVGGGTMPMFWLQAD